MSDIDLAERLVQAIGDAVDEIEEAPDAVPIFRRIVMACLALESHDLSKWLDEREFYELMQAYRHTPAERQGDVIRAFELVKAGIIQAFVASNIDGK